MKYAAIIISVWLVVQGIKAIDLESMHGVAVDTKMAQVDCMVDASLCPQQGE